MMKFTNTHSTQAGFSLVEMAIVLTIVGVLLAGLLPTLSSQVAQQRRNETQKYMGEVRDALLGFAVTNGRLPCPDTNNDGAAEATCTAATPNSQYGTLPYKDLAVTDKDAYGKVLIYAVTPTFATAAPFTLATAGVMRICTTSACTANLTSTAVAVIVSQGANSATASADETQNSDKINNDFVSHDLVQNGFDDLVVWLSPNTLFNRMVAAGKLP